MKRFSYPRELFTRQSGNWQIRTRQRSARDSRHGFSMLDLLVVLAIIGLLLTILLPAMARAREQSKYVRWQAFSRDLSMDEHMAVYYNFQNDRGGTYISNITVANHDPTYLPFGMDLLMHDYSQPTTLPNPQMVRYFWSTDGRFRNKPAAAFLNSGPSDNMAIYPAVPEGSGMLGRLLRQSQAITVAVWIYVPPTQTGQKTSIMYWSDPLGKRILNIDLPWANYVSWETYGWPAGNNTYVQFGYGIDSPWSLWCFTKDNHTGFQKIYQNGQLVAVSSGWLNVRNPWLNFAITPDPPASNTSPSNFRFGGSLGYGSCAATIDEFAIFDSDLSPDDVTSAGNPIPGVDAVRFLQMYQMGCP